MNISASEQTHKRKIDSEIHNNSFIRLGSDNSIVETNHNKTENI
jgi:hypothetical protein